MASPHCTVLEEAAELTEGARARDYDHPSRNFERIAVGWSVIFGVEVTPEQVGLANIWQKVARQVHTPKRDNLVDICGYSRTIEKLQEPDVCPRT